MAQGDITMTYEKKDLVRILGERIRTEKEQYDEAMKEYRVERDVYRKAAASALREYAGFVSKGKLPTFANGYGGTMDADNYMVSQAGIAPKQPNKPRCRKTELKRLQATTQDVLKLNGGQYISLVGADPCDLY